MALVKPLQADSLCLAEIYTVKKVNDFPVSGRTLFGICKEKNAKVQDHNSEKKFNKEIIAQTRTVNEELSVKPLQADSLCLAEIYTVKKVNDFPVSSRTLFGICKEKNVKVQNHNSKKSFTRK